MFLSFLRFQFALLISLVLIGCEGDSDSSVGAEGENDFAGESLTIYSWEEYFSPDLLANFEKETGAQIKYLTFSNTEEMEARVKSEPEKYDLVVTDDATVELLLKLDLLQELNHKWLPSLGNIGESYKKQPYDSGNQWSAPYTWGLTLVAYRKDKIIDPEPSWDLLWSEQARGRIMMLEERFEPFAIALYRMGKSPNTSESAAFETALEALLSQVSEQKVVYGDDVEVKKQLSSGDVWAAMCYSGDAALLSSENSEIDYFVPQEGAPMWVDSMVIPRDSRKELLAHAFIEFMLRPDSAAATSKYTGCATPNVASLQLIEPQMRDDPRIFPPDEVLESCKLLTRMNPEREVFVNGGWLKINQAIRKHAVGRDQVSGNDPK